MFHIYLCPCSLGQYRTLSLPAGSLKVVLKKLRVLGVFYLASQDSAAQNPVCPSKPAKRLIIM